MSSFIALCGYLIKFLLSTRIAINITIAILEIVKLVAEQFTK